MDKDGFKQIANALDPDHKIIVDIMHASNFTQRVFLEKLAAYFGYEAQQRMEKAISDHGEVDTEFLAEAQLWLRPAAEIQRLYETM